jgi:hypothetical protein
MDKIYITIKGQYKKKKEAKEKRLRLLNHMYTSHTGE